MSPSSAEIAHILIVLALLLLVAHALGYLFAVLRQPPVIGEILGGLILGPTVLGVIRPSLENSLFPATGPATDVLGGISELGLLFLMFVAGRELRSVAPTTGRRTIMGVTLGGLVIPFAAGLAVAQLYSARDLSGPTGSGSTFSLVIAIGIAVTSIPVISRIMLDLGIIKTVFARIVLSVAVLEDMALYIALAVLLGLVQAKNGGGFGLWSITGIRSVAWSAAYYVVVSVIFLSVFLLTGRFVFSWLAHRLLRPLERRNATAFRLVFLFMLVLCCVLLGINPVFGALVAGLSVARADDAASSDAGAIEADLRDHHPEQDSGQQAWTTISRFSLAFFIPFYFALVGVQLDIVHGFPVGFFFSFVAIACVLKLTGVWAGARLSGENARMSLNLAVAMNARGGPGIVLATVTLSAGIINKSFFAVLVLLSVLTSQAAGTWLDREFKLPSVASDVDASAPLTDAAIDHPGDPEGDPAPGGEKNVQL